MNLSIDRRGPRRCLRCFAWLTVAVSSARIGCAEDVSALVPRRLVDLFDAGEFRASAGDEQKVFHYRLFDPHSGQSKKRYPIVVWTSGFGEAGDDNFAQLRHLEYILRDEERPDRYRFFLLAMQAPADHPNWIDQSGVEPATALMNLLDHLTLKHPIDPDRVYLAGVSAGGEVCWELAMRHPEKFAAMLPMASPGATSPVDERLKTITHLPVWAFHSIDDPDTHISGVRKTVQFLNDEGGIVALTEVDRDVHDCWSTAFLKYDALDWLLAQRRGAFCWYRPGWQLKALLYRSWPLGVVLLVFVAHRAEKRRRRKVSTPISQAKNTDETPYMSA